MAIDTETLRAKAREIDEAEKAVRDFRASIGERFKRFVLTDMHPDAWEPATFDQIVTEVEAGRALDTMVETRKAEFDALVNGKPKRKRAKKAAEKKGDEKPAPRRALGRKGLPKTEPAGGVA